MPLPVMRQILDLGMQHGVKDKAFDACVFCRTDDDIADPALVGRHIGGDIIDRFNAPHRSRDRPRIGQRAGDDFRRAQTGDGRF